MRNRLSERLRRQIATRADARRSEMAFAGYAEVGDESLCDCESCARIDMEDRLDLLKCERRYMYDVVRLIDAYEKMWDDEPIDVDDRMLALEHNRDVPGEPLWQDVAFLNDLAYSLMGDVMAHDLILGFERARPQAVRPRCRAAGTAYGDARPVRSAVIADNRVHERIR